MRILTREFKRAINPSRYLDDRLRRALYHWATIPLTNVVDGRAEALDAAFKQLRTDAEKRGGEHIEAIHRLREAVQEHAYAFRAARDQQQRQVSELAHELRMQRNQIALLIDAFTKTSPRVESAGDGRAPEATSSASGDRVPPVADRNGRMAAAVVLYSDGSLVWHWPREGQTIGEMIGTRFEAAGVRFGNGGTRLYQEHPAKPRNTFAEQFADTIGLDGEILHGAVVLTMCDQDERIPIRSDVAEAVVAHSASWMAEA